MDLLQLARGPLLYFALTVFLFGIAWRLSGLWRFGAKPALSAPRATDTASAGIRTVFSRMLPRKGFHPSATLATINPYVYHIGLAIVAFGYLPHIDFIKRLAGLSWPALPDWVMYVSAGATIVSLGVALLYRLTDPVLRLSRRLQARPAWRRARRAARGAARTRRGFPRDRSARRDELVLRRRRRRVPHQPRGRPAPEGVRAEAAADRGDRRRSRGDVLRQLPAEFHERPGEHRLAGEDREPGRAGRCQPRRLSAMNDFDVSLE